MKSNSRGNSPRGFKRNVLIVSFLAAMGMLAVIGCQNSIPVVGTYGAPASQINRDSVADFNTLAMITPSVSLIQNPSFNAPVVYKTSNKPVYSYPINPSLFDAGNPPSYTLKSPSSATVTVLNNFKAYCGFTYWGLVGLGGNGPNGDAFGYRMSGPVTDQGDAAFPELDLCAYPEGGAFFDASNFTGVQFYLMIASDDTTIQRHFAIPVKHTLAPVAGGDCTAGPSLCYDHFAADVSGGTGGQWEFFRYNFSDLKQLVSGAIPNPPTLSGENLQEIMWLQWSGSRNNKPGVSNLDFYVDQISFFK